MKYDFPLLSGRFIKRYKRFFADIETEQGELLTLYCPNTGSMKGCLQVGSLVRYTLHGDSKKKLPGTLEQIQISYGNSDYWVGLNTQRDNGLTYEAMLEGCLPTLAGYHNVVPEVRYGNENSKIDFLLSANDDEGDKKQSVYVEVKSVTLCDESGVGLFPDAKTIRGQKHLRELSLMAEAGHRAVIVFCVQHQGVKSVSIASDIDPIYASLFEAAFEKGLEVCAYRVKFNEDGQSFDCLLPFQFYYSL